MDEGENDTMTTMTTTGFLSDELIGACGQRAAGYDRDNHFFTEDWDAIKETGFLKINTPKELGGYGGTPSDVSRELRRLAYRAPATALAVNMHLYWTAIAAGLWNHGDKSLEWMLRECVEGQVYAAGHAEAGDPYRSGLSETRCSACGMENALLHRVDAGTICEDCFIP